MSSRITGLERVPNVYVKKIVLSNESTKDFKMFVDLQVNDSRASGGDFVWSNSTRFKSFFKVAVIATSHPGISSLINNGSIIPLPGNIRKLRQYGSETIIKTLSISDFKQLDGPSTRKFTNKCEYTILKKYENLNIYVVPYIDMLEVGSNLTMTVPDVFKAYLGAVTSETVLKYGKPQKISTMFLMQNNDDIWMGPVHNHDGVYMAGSSHTGDNHPSLRAYQVENTKLIDKRKKSYSVRKQTSNPADAVIGGIMISPGNGARLTGLFPINMRQIATRYTKMGNIISSMNDAIFQEFLQSIEIRGMYITRKGVKVTTKNNKTGSRMMIPRKVFSWKPIESIDRIYLDPTGFIRHYQFIDESTVNDMTDYMYDIKLVLVDKSQDFLTNKLRTLESNLATLQSEVTILNKRGNYNYASKSLRKSVSNSMSSIIRSYYTTLAYFLTIDTVAINENIEATKKKFMKGNYTPQDGDAFVEEYKKVILKFRSRFETKRRLASNHLKQSVNNNFTPGTVTLEKTWQPIIKFADYKYSYDCLGEETATGLVTITFDKLNKRGTMEVDRFFDKEKTLESEGMGNLSIKNRTALKDISTFKNTFLSPLSFNSGNKKISIRNLADVNNEELVVNFFEAQKSKNSMRRPNKGFIHKSKKKNVPANRRSERKGRRQRTASKKPFSSAFKISRVNTVLKLNTLNPIEPTISSADYLGPNSEFVDGEANYDQVAPQTDAMAVETSLKSALMITTNRNKFDFDLTSDRNFIGEFVNNKKLSTYRLQKAPVQFKALVASRSPAARNNIMEAQVDMLRNPVTKVAMEMTFQVTQKIQVLGGYEKDNYGVEMINKPMWMDLGPSMLSNKSSVLCRMVYHEDPTLGLKPDESFKMPIQNAFFLLSTRNLSLETIASMTSPINSQPISSASDRLSTHIAYASSNIVKQPLTPRPLLNQTKPSTRATTTGPEGGGAY